MVSGLNSHLSTIAPAVGLIQGRSNPMISENLESSPPSPSPQSTALSLPGDTAFSVSVEGRMKVTIPFRKVVLSFSLYTNVRQWSAHFLKQASGLSCFSHVQLCDLMNYSLQGSSVHGILSARRLEWAATPFSRDLPNPGIEPISLVLWQAGSLPPAPSEKPKASLGTKI